MIELPITKYRFTLRPKEKLLFPSEDYGGKTAALRGALGYGLKGLLCPDVRLLCPRCELRNQCLYPKIFTLGPDNHPGKLSRNQDLPRPFLIRPFLDGRREYTSHSPFVFDLFLFGFAVQHLDYVFIAFKNLEAQGIGIGRGQFRLERIESVGLQGQVLNVVHDGSKYLKPLTSEFDVSIPDTGTSLLAMRFLTPVTIKAEGRILEKPRFHHLVKRLRDRISSLIQFYTALTIDWDFKEIGLFAERIEEVENSLRWINRFRRAGHSRETHDLGGAVGRLVVRGEALKNLFPLLWLGQYTGIGKNAVFGNGWYELET